MGYVCSACKIEKEKDDFFVNTSKARGFQYKCKVCVSEYRKKRYFENREVELVKMTKSRLKPENVIQRKGYYEKNKEQYKERYNRYMSDSEKKVARSECGKARYKRNRDAIRERHRLNYLKQKESGVLSKKHQERKASDPEYNLKRRLRFRLRHIVDALGANKQYKFASVISLLGCDLPFFKAHLESQFQDGMSWSNMDEWHVDHREPCANFDLTKEEEQRKCFHWSNLQPLFELDNLSKGTKTMGEWKQSKS
jgi:hypothetical protein